MACEYPPPPEAGVQYRTYVFQQREGVVAVRARHLEHAAALGAHRLDMALQTAERLGGNDGADVA